MHNEKGDFTTSRRTLWITLLALGIGAVGSVTAMALMKLIGFFTNLFFFQTFSWSFASPAQNHLGWWVILPPVVGGILVGLMARYGSDRIRGHGIPEALEAILFGKSKMSLKVALLKPISSAIAIGSGGPFGAEGPIIMTGGAFGSLMAQAFHLTAAERKTLLVAGACAGMSAVFFSPLAATLLAVELLLFELKPRSIIPVAAACVVAAMLRPFLLGPGPLFPVPEHPVLPLKGLLFSILCGLIAGLASALLTKLVYILEDLFQKLPFHWMWFPAIGGMVVGIGGYFEPKALGVGYDVIADFLKGDSSATAAFFLILVKAFIWSFALGSGTSGGVLAPLLIIGGGLGVAEAAFFPAEGANSLWPLVSMTAILGGVMRVPFCAVAFALELTHDTNAILPLLIASIAAYTITVLTMKRSILTEKVARRGFHVLREYTVDLLERNHVGDVMTRKPLVFQETWPLSRALKIMGQSHKHQGYPVVDATGRLVGMVSRWEIMKNRAARDLKIRNLMNPNPIVAYPSDPCRAAAARMARHHIGRLPVVSSSQPWKLLGILTRSDLLKLNERHFEEEEVHEKFIGVVPSKVVKLPSSRPPFQKGA
ncbi:MAG TPA: chloride channel protein [bacterium]|nr:chloride channel protein [bacterium]